MILLLVVQSHSKRKYTMPARENCCNSRKTFWGVFGVAQLFGLLAIFILVLWNCVYNKGYQWGHRNQQFAIHPLVMILGMVYLNGNGAMVYRVLECFNRSQVKVIHLVIMALVVLLSIFGVYTVFNYHAYMNYGNMYTMHSWCGMINVVAFGLQFFVGFGVLMWPGLKGKYLNMYMPIHRYTSLAILALTLASIMSGVVEDLLMCMDNREYRELPLHAVLFNVVGLLCMGYILLVMYITYRDDWKRGTKLLPAEDATVKEADTQKEPALTPETAHASNVPQETDKLLP